MQDIAEQVLALASRSATWAEVYAAREEETPVSFKANRLHSIETREARGLALRVVVEGRIGFASSSQLDEPELLVRDALATARFGPASALAYPTQQVQDPGLGLYDQRIADLSADTMVQIGQQMIDRVRAHGEDILCDADVRKSTGTVLLLNSSGGQGTYCQTVVWLGLNANRVRGTDILDIWEEDASCHLAAIDAEGVVRTVLEKLDLAEEIAPIRTASLPVIFTPKGVYMTLLAPLQAALNGKLVLQGASPLAGRLGERVFDPGFSVFDDGRVPGQPTSAPMDGEGVPTRRTALVQEGSVSAFYYDLQTAGLAGTESTGNGQRGLTSLPSPATHALRIVPGTASYEAMLSDISEGLLVDQTMGAWAGNVLGGQFSGNVHLGFRIEKGRLVGRVKDTMVAGNVFEALAHLAGIGDRAHWVGGRAEIPYLYIPSLAVSAR
ncbi:MAG: TldD/PmbA family protein [Anaerolineae bacterium]|nr:TldD/PmbA family protein [Anaerolineae bacterium]